MHLLEEVTHGWVLATATGQDRGFDPEAVQVVSELVCGSIDEVAAGSSRIADWVPTLVDYLYVSVTNSTAFSPTDTMPLSVRAKLLMTVESVAALITSVLVIARAVSTLK